MRDVIGFAIFLALVVPTIASAVEASHSQSMVAHSVVLEPEVTRVTALRAVSMAASLLPARTVRRRVGAADPATLCETAVTTAEYVHRLPARLLGAISLTETGRLEAASGRLRPWPWTINAEGEGQFFDTKEAAIAAVKALGSRGVRSIDVGCLQVNLMFHPDAFASLEEAFEPRSNANYAARFLNALHADGRAPADWMDAVAAYHSETPVLGDAYRVLVMARWQNGDLHAPVARRVAYGDFAETGKVYGDKAYGAFAPRSLVYGAFAPR